MGKCKKNYYLFRFSQSIESFWIFYIAHTTYLLNHTFSCGRFQINHMILRFETIDYYLIKTINNVDWSIFTNLFGESMRIEQSIHCRLFKPSSDLDQLIF